MRTLYLQRTAAHRKLAYLSVTDIHTYEHTDAKQDAKQDLLPRAQVLGNCIIIGASVHNETHNACEIDRVDLHVHEFK